MGLGLGGEFRCRHIKLVFKNFTTKAHDLTACTIAEVGIIVAKIGTMEGIFVSK